MGRTRSTLMPLGKDLQKRSHYWVRIPERLVFAQWVNPSQLQQLLFVKS